MKTWWGHTSPGPAASDRQAVAGGPRRGGGRRERILRTVVRHSRRTRAPHAAFRRILPKLGQGHWEPCKKQVSGLFKGPGTGWISGAKPRTPEKPLGRVGRAYNEKTFPQRKKVEQALKRIRACANRLMEKNADDFHP